MNRKQFIESHGATCRNWTWSWSFVNDNEQFVIFGAWDRTTEGNTAVILSEDWEISSKGRKQSAYAQSREHIRLVEEEGYTLMTFPMKYSDEYKDEEGVGPAKIKGFDPVLTEKSLMRVGNAWYASDNVVGTTLPEEVVLPQQYFEGASKTVSVNTYERNPDARARCIEHHGYRCAVCSFDFEEFYGEIGKEYIHVHHVVPLSEIQKEYELDPLTDLVPVCPNCHSIIHRTQPPLTVAQLKGHLKKRQKI